MLAGTTGELTSVRFAGLQDRGDLGVRVVERLVEHVGGPLPRCEALEQHPDAKFQRPAVLGPESWVVTRVATGSDNQRPVGASRQKHAPTGRR